LHHVARHKSLLHTVILIQVKYVEFEDRPKKVVKTCGYVKIFLTEDC